MLEYPCCPSLPCSFSSCTHCIVIFSEQRISFLIPFIVDHSNFFGLPVDVVTVYLEQFRHCQPYWCVRSKTVLIYAVHWLCLAVYVMKVWDTHEAWFAIENAMMQALGLFCLTRHLGNLTPGQVLLIINREIWCWMSEMSYGFESELMVLHVPYEGLYATVRFGINESISKVRKFFNFFCKICWKFEEKMNWRRILRYYDLAARGAYSGVKWVNTVYFSKGAAHGTDNKRRSNVDGEVASLTMRFKVRIRTFLTTCPESWAFCNSRSHMPVYV